MNAVCCSVKVDEVVVLFGGGECRGAMNKKELGLWCRRGLLAYVYNGVSC